MGAQSLAVWRPFLGEVEKNRITRHSPVDSMIHDPLDKTGACTLNQTIFIMSHSREIRRTKRGPGFSRSSDHLGGGFGNQIRPSGASFSASAGRRRNTASQRRRAMSLGVGQVWGFWGW